MNAKTLLLTVATLALTQTAKADWPNIFNSTNEVTEGRRIVTDLQGNVIVCSFISASDFSNPGNALTKFNRFGVLQWSTEFGDYFSGQTDSIDVDDSGAIYLLGGNDDNVYLTLKYSPNGSRLWARTTVADGNGYSSATKVVALAGGGCIVTGSSLSFANSYDAYTVKYSSNGTKVWSKQLDVASKAEHVSDLAINDDGEIFITGTTSIGDNGDVLIAKYGKGGQRHWVRTFDGANGGTDYDEGLKLDVDSSGGVVIAGRASGPNDTYDAMLFRYSSNGVKLWHHRFFRDVTSDRAGHIRITDDNTIVLLAELGMGGDKALNYLIRKYDLGGELIWSRLISRRDVTGLSTLGYCTGMEVDSAGNIFYAGRAVEGGQSIFMTTKMTSQGSTVWEKTYRPNEWARPAAATFDHVYNKFYVTGHGPDDEGALATVTIKN